MLSASCAFPDQYLAGRDCGDGIAVLVGRRGAGVASDEIHLVALDVAARDEDGG